MNCSVRNFFHHFYEIPVMFIRGISYVIIWYTYIRYFLKKYVLPLILFEMKYEIQGVLELRGFEQRGFEQCGFLERFKEFWAMRFYTIKSSSYTILRSRSSRKIAILKTNNLNWVTRFWSTRTFTKTKNRVAEGPPVVCSNFAFMKKIFH